MKSTVYEYIEVFCSFLSKRDWPLEENFYKAIQMLAEKIYKTGYEVGYEAGKRCNIKIMN